MVGWHHRFEWTCLWVMAREAWHASVHGVTISQTRLSDLTELNRTTTTISYTIRSVTMHDSLHSKLDLL